MTITGEVLQAQAGIIGFDTTDRLNPATAKQYYNKGYRFCVRYIARDGKSKFDDLIETESQAIVNSGMALMAVQHPLAEGWVPTEAMGQSFGSGARKFAGDAGLPLGVTVWLDLESKGRHSRHRRYRLLQRLVCRGRSSRVFDRSVYRRFPGDHPGSDVLESQNQKLLERRIECKIRRSGRYPTSWVSTDPAYPKSG